MVILHIASISNNPFSGVSVVVPQYIIEQERLGHYSALLNLKKEKIKDITNQFYIGASFNLDSLPAPFNKPDLVIFQECYQKEYLSIYRCFGKKSIPYIIIPHGELGEEAQQKKHLKKVAANLLLFNRFIKSAVAIQCLSQREYNATHFGRKKILATNGVYIPVRQKVYTPQDEGKINLVYIGRLDAYHKGLDLLIAAISEIHQVFIEQNIVLDIYGPDILGRLAYLKNLIAQESLDDVIKTHSEISGDEKTQVLLSSDIFIQTSRFEGMPLGILEALSYGIPCIITEGTTLADVVNDYHAGWNAGKTAESIAASIETCINKREQWASIGSNGRKLVKQEYSWGSIMSNTINQYEDLIRGSK